MNIAEIIAQIKTYVPQLGGRVSGAADFASGLESVVNMTLPAAFVLRLDDDASPNDLWPGLQQMVTERMAVVVEFDNTGRTHADARTGYAGVNQVDDMRAAIFSAVLSWLPSDHLSAGPRGFAYGGGRLLDFDRARLFWQFEFTIENTITDSDGFILRGDPLIDIQGTIQPSGDPGGGPAIITDIPLI